MLICFSKPSGIIHTLLAYMFRMSWRFTRFYGRKLRRFLAVHRELLADYKRSVFAHAILPLFGFAFCTLIWWNLKILAMTVSGIWLAAGLIYVAIRTRGFRAAPVIIDFTES
jgi:hypothetical protein